MKKVIVAIGIILLLCTSAKASAQLRPVDVPVYVPVYVPPAPPRVFFQPVVYRYYPVQPQPVKGGYIYQERRFGLFGNKGRVVKYYRFGD